MAKPENRLVEQAKAGSADAFGQLYAQYAQDLYRFAYYYLGSREEAEDAVQDAVCAAFQGIGALRSVSSFKAWLFSILSNTCKHHIAAVKERRLVPFSEKYKYVMSQHVVDAVEAAARAVYPEVFVTSD